MKKEQMKVQYKNGVGKVVKKGENNFIIRINGHVYLLRSTPDWLLKQHLDMDPYQLTEVISE